MGNWLMDCGEFQCVVTSALPAIAHLPEVKLQLSHTHTHSWTRVLWGNTLIHSRCVSMPFCFIVRSPCPTVWQIR